MGGDLGSAKLLWMYSPGSAPILGPWAKGGDSGITGQGHCETEHREEGGWLQAAVLALGQQHSDSSEASSIFFLESPPLYPSDRKLPLSGSSIGKGQSLGT